MAAWMAVEMWCVQTKSTFSVFKRGGEKTGETLCVTSDIQVKRGEQGS